VSAWRRGNEGRARNEREVGVLGEVGDWGEDRVRGVISAGWKGPVA
jgi:hypothetical protein